MNIDINLSSESINAAIRRLQTAKENLEVGVQDAVEVLARDGAETAQEAFGGMANATSMRIGTTRAQIIASGKAAIIAEFGAGYATMEYHPFAKNAPVPIKVASYSESTFPRGLFFVSDSIHPGEGYWFFGGREYDRVQPGHGLLNAYDFILNNAGEIVGEVIKL